jgi:hypothetical protein
MPGSSRVDLLFENVHIAFNLGFDRPRGPEPDMRTHLPMLVKAWFVLDLFLAWFPPLHWAASGADPVFGIPRSLCYLFAVSSFIATSVVVAYFCDSSLRPDKV